MLSVPHLVIIFLVALIVLGPEKLPQVARVLGKAMADFRRVTTDFRSQIEDEMRDMERQTRIQQMNAETVRTAEAASAELAASTQLLGAPPAEDASTHMFGHPPSEAPPTIAAPPAPTAPEKPADGEPRPA